MFSASVLTLPHVLDLPLTPVTSWTVDVYISQISAGSRHSVAVACDGRAYSWGCNDYGQLGHGDLVSRRCPTVIGWFVEQQLTVEQVFGGYWNTVFACHVTQ